MKSLVFLSLFSFVCLGFSQPDILVNAQIDKQWTSILVKKVRQLLVNYGYTDPLNAKIEEELILADSEMSEFMSEDAKTFMLNLGHSLGIDILKTRSVLKIKGLKYDIKNLYPNVKLSHSKNRLNIEGEYFVSGLNIEMSEVELSFLLQKSNGQDFPILKIKMINPKLSTHENFKIPFDANIDVLLNNEKINFRLNQSDFSQTLKFMKSHQDLVTTDFGQFDIPEVEIGIQNKIIKIKPSKIEELIRSLECEFKAFISEQIALHIEKGAGEKILKVIEDVDFNREYWVQADQIMSLIKVDSFKSTQKQKTVEAIMPGDFCTTENFLVLKELCVQEMALPTSRMMDYVSYQKSLSFMDFITDQQNANFLLSISENYVNKLIKATYEAGYWDSSLKSAGVLLGPNKMFIKFDQAGETATLYLDVIYKLSKWQKVALTKKEIRFPLVMKTSMRIDNNNGVAHIVFHLNDVDLSHQTLLSGVKDTDFEFGVKNIPYFRKLIMKEIRKQVSPFIGQDMLTIPYQELSGIGLEKVKFQSDGLGRMNAYANLLEMGQ